MTFALKLTAQILRAVADRLDPPLAVEVMTLDEFMDATLVEHRRALASIARDN